MLSFEEFDKNQDGKISDGELDSLFKEIGLDTVEFSTVDKKGDKEVTKEEYDTWEQEIKMQEAVNQFSGQIAKDFIGSNSKLAPQVMSELKDFVNEFIVSYKQEGGKISEMAKKFAEILPDKYEEIKSSFLSDAADNKKEVKESFRQVRKEMSENVPDSTSTYEEKELAIKYIDRMLACDDIPNDAKAFWTNQRAVIKEEQSHCLPKEPRELAEAWKDYVEENWHDGDFPSVEKRIEYFETYIDFMDKILACDNVPPELRAEFKRMREGAVQDLENTKANSGKSEDSASAKIMKDYEAYKKSNFKIDMKKEEKIEYYNTCIEFLNKILRSSDSTLQEKMVAIREKVLSVSSLCMIGNEKIQKDEYKKAVENFYDYFSSVGNLEEYVGTKSGQKMALDLIYKILVCEDIPEDERSKWLELQRNIEEQYNEKNDSDSRNLWI